MTAWASCLIYLGVGTVLPAVVHVLALGTPAEIRQSIIVSIWVRVVPSYMSRRAGANEGLQNQAVYSNQLGAATVVQGSKQMPVMISARSTWSSFPSAAIN